MKRITMEELPELKIILEEIEENNDLPYDYEKVIKQSESSIILDTKKATTIEFYETLKNTI